MNVLIVTDLEGVSGIVDWDRHEPGTPLDAWQRRLMTCRLATATWKQCYMRKASALVATRST